LDMIVANDVSQKGAGFEIDTNSVTIITKDGSADAKGEKIDVAHKILDEIKKLY